MAHIRDDLEGVVYAFRTNGDTVVLSAGDEIPSDISLGSHLVAESKPVANAEVPAPAAQPRRGRAKNSPGGSDASSDDK